MEKDELNERIKLLLESSSNCQEFADLTSVSENWRKIDKNIAVPKHIGLKEEDCPSCFEPIKLIYDKFSTTDDEFDLICPHCKETIKCKLEFTGYTSEIYLEEK